MKGITVFLSAEEISIDLPVATGLPRQCVYVRAVDENQETWSMALNKKCYWNVHGSWTMSETVYVCLNRCENRISSSSVREVRCEQRQKFKDV